MPIEREAASDWLKPWRSRRYHLMGVPVDPLRQEEIERLFCESVKQQRRVILANVNLHALYCADQSAGMRTLLAGSETIVQIDGMPIVWLGRTKGADVGADCRLTHIDLLPPLLRLCAAHGWHVAFVGGAPAKEGEKAEALCRIATGLQVLCIPGYKNEGAEAEIIASLNKFQPQLLLIGMGMPRQEAWIATNANKLNATFIMPVGGFIDYFTGRTSKPPRLLGRFGLEWAWRLAQEPKRLAFRYLVEPILLIKAFMRRGHSIRNLSSFPPIRWGAAGCPNCCGSFNLSNSKTSKIRQSNCTCCCRGRKKYLMTWLNSQTFTFTLISHSSASARRETC